MTLNTIKFGDFAKFKYGKMPKKSEIRTAGMYPIYSGYRYVGTYDEFNTEANQLIIVARGVGGTGDVKLTKERCFLTNLSISAQIDERVALPKYLYYYFLLRNLRYLDSGSAQSQITISDLEKVEMSLPSIENQKKIIDFLSSMDMKIMNNNLINNNLEQQIQNCCNAWFSDYALSKSADLVNWSKVPLSSIAEFTSGYSYKGAELKKSNIAMATIKNFDRNGGFKLDGYKEILPSSKLKYSQHVELFDTLVAHTDLTQNAEVIGNAELVMSKSGYDDIVFSMDLVKVTPKNSQISKFLIAAILQDKKFKNHCLGYINGTTVLHLSKKALPDYQLYLPEDFSILKPLDNIVTALYRKMSSNIEENIKLKTTRDALLSKLMSGELDISNLEL